MSFPKPVSILMKLVSVDREVRKTIHFRNANQTPNGVEFDILDNDGQEYYCYLIPKSRVKEVCIQTTDEVPDTIDGLIKKGGV